jgi:alpha-amylase
MSNDGPASKRMYVGLGRAGEEWTDLLRPQAPPVIIDKSGYGLFPVEGLSVSVWVPAQTATGLEGEKIHSSL